MTRFTTLAHYARRLGAGVGLLVLGGVVARAQAPRYYHQHLLERYGLRYDSAGRVQATTFPGGGRPGYYIGSTVCDSLGNLRFAVTSGATGGRDNYLYDRAGQPVQTVPPAFAYTPRLYASRLLVPVPGSNRYFYLFQMPTQYTVALPNVMTYTVLDGAGVRGGAMYDSLEVPLHNNSMVDFGGEPVFNGMTVARHANGRDLWLITARAGQGWLSYRITPAGLDRRHPVVSYYPDALLPGFCMSGIELSLNHQVLFGGGSFPMGFPPGATGTAWYAFDRATGQIGAPHPAPGLGTGGEYPVALSPSGRFVYGVEAANRLPTDTSYAIVQFDLRAGSAAAILASRQVVAERRIRTQYNSWKWLHTGLDGRIYAVWGGHIFSANTASDTVSIIARPDRPGSACGYQPVGLRLPGTQNAARYQHTPAAYNAVLPVLRVVAPVCPGDTSRLALSAPGAVDSVRWHYADGSGVVDTGFVARHVFPGPGQWPVTVTYRYGGYAVDSLRQTVTVAPAPPAVLLAAAADPALCVDRADSLTLAAVAGLPAGTRLRWTGPGTTAADTLASLRVRAPGTYGLEARLGPCAGRDSVVVSERGCGGPGPAEFVANVVTPNGDGLNEGLVVELAGAWGLEVFDRWGRRVWASGAGAYVSGAWGGQGVSGGVYYYVLRRVADGRRLKGWVEVVK